MSWSEINMYLDQYFNKNHTSPIGPDYQNMCKMKAEVCLSNGNSDAEYWLTESLAASLRTMALYRHEQLTQSKDSFLETLAKFPISVEKLNTSNKSTRDYSETYSFPTEFEEINKDIELAEGLSRCTVDCDPPHIKILRFTNGNKSSLPQTIKEFPKEWTVLQLTAPFNPNEIFKPRKIFQTEIFSFYLTVLRNEFVDLCNLEPFTVKIKSNQVAESEKELLVELYSLLEDNLNILEHGGTFCTKNNVHKYWERREDTDLRMKGVIDTMDKRWLCGWKCLLTGKFKDRDLSKIIFDMVEVVCADWGFLRITLKQKMLLAILLSNCHKISSNDLRTTIKIILLDYLDESTFKATIDTTVKIGCAKCNLNWEFRAKICGKCSAAIFEKVHDLKLIDGIKAFMGLAGDMRNGAKVPQLKAAERLPVILIVDEMLDTFPWESLPILAEHPVTRMESIHFLYSLFKMNESRISDGYFTLDPKIGKFIINPANNLEKMEKRMSSFVSYWCPDWEGVKNQPPEPDEFLQYLRDADLFLYCGHGDGCEYAQDPRRKRAGLEAAGRVKVAALLSGCNSVRLHSSGGRVSPLASHHYYHIVGSPVVVGMLWEVTDLEVDKVMSTLLATFISSDAPVAWEDIDKTHWSEGKLNFNAEGKGTPKQKYDLLTAISKARRSSNFIMISSSVVSRGLPVRSHQT